MVVCLQAGRRKSDLSRHSVRRWSSTELTGPSVGVRGADKQAMRRSLRVILLLLLLSCGNGRSRVAARRGCLSLGALGLNENIAQDSSQKLRLVLEGVESQVRLLVNEG